MKKLLLIEDDPILGEGLEIFLRLEKYDVTRATSLKSSFEIFHSSKFDIVILDLGLPDGHGLEFCKYQNVRSSNIPIIILTAQDNENSVVEGLEAGASDYVKKPFGHKELSARIKVLLRNSPREDEVISIGNLSINKDLRKIFHEDKEVKLNRKEYEVLRLFIENADRVLSREHIIKKINADIDVNDRTIDSHISHIRSKLKKLHINEVKITSEYGVGYRLVHYA